MKITLNPIGNLPNQTPDTPPTVTGETLTYRGETYDLSQLPDGATVGADEPFVGNISRIDGVIHAGLQYTYDCQLAEDNQSTDIADYTFDVADGQCPDPIIYRPEPEIEDEPEIEEVEEPTNDD